MCACVMCAYGGISSNSIRWVIDAMPWMLGADDQVKIQIHHHHQHHHHCLTSNRGVEIHSSVSVALLDA